MFRRLSTTHQQSSLLHSYSKHINMKDNCSYVSRSRALNISYMIKDDNFKTDMCFNKSIRRSLFLPSIYMPVLHTDRSELILPHKHILKLKFTSSAATNESSVLSKASETFKKLYRKVIPEPLSVSTTTLHRSGAILSSCCTHEVDLETFFKTFDMPDTYYSWWLITELHVWMLCVRLHVGNSKEGNICRNFMVEQLYIDAFDRAKKVADMDSKERKNAIWDLAEEFKFAMCLYDLGLAGNDVDLANSIWRRFFLGTDDPDVEQIELLVKYVRKTVASLDQMKLEDLFSMEPGVKLNWPCVTKLELTKK